VSSGSGEAGARALRSALAAGRWARPFLLVGGVGGPADDAAQAFLAAVLCTGRGERGAVACGACGGCHRFSRGIHPDFAVLEPEKGRVGIGVDPVDDILQWLSLRPVEAGGRAVHVPGAERLTDQAQNALLKTLEEPPPRTTLVLRVSAPRGLLDTVRSRCATVRFPPADGSLLRARAVAAAKQPEGVEALLGAAAGDAARLEAAVEGDVVEGAALLRAALAPRVLASADPLAALDPAARWLTGKGGDLEGRRERLRMVLRSHMAHLGVLAGGGSMRGFGEEGYDALPRPALGGRLAALGEARARVEHNVDPVAILEGLAMSVRRSDEEWA
jgi:DNA polymerase-3 subunit delta'